MGNDVVITGIGMVTTLGSNVAETVGAWRMRTPLKSRTIPELSGTDFAAVRIAGLTDFDPVERLSKRRMAKFMSDPALLGCVAAREAMVNAGVADNARFPAERVGLFAATGMAAADIDESIAMLRTSLDEQGEFSIRQFGEKGLHAINPLLSFKILANMPGCLVSITENIKGPSYIFTPWEDQTGAAIIEAIESLRNGEVDCAVVVASDIPSHPANLVYLLREKFITPDEIAAPGAACLVLEREESAVGAGRPYQKISRVNLTNSKTGINDPLSKQLGRTIAAAPLILLGLAAGGIDIPVRIDGCGGQIFTAEVKA